MAGLKEIARAAGVSARTVSRVLRNENNVAPETSARIRELASNLGYRPNLAAKSLRSRRSHEIVLVMWSLEPLQETAELYLGKVGGLEYVFGQNDLPLKVRIARQHIQSPDYPAAVVEELIHQPPLGVALFPLKPHLTRRCMADLARADIPSVVMDELEGDPEIDNISMNRVQAVHDAVQHLILRGQRRIAYLGPDEVPSRMVGYRAALNAAGLEPIYLFIPTRLNAEMLFQQGRAMARNILTMNPRPDAVQAYSDPLALGFIDGLKEIGVRVPEEVAVVGFDDRRSAVLCHPQLTTIAHPNREIGMAAARVLLDKIAGKPRPAGGWSQSIPGRLVIRESA